MSSTASDHSPAGLEEKLATYWRMVEERETLETRIAKAKTARESVNERVFRRVLSGYEEALTSLAARLDPLEKELDAMRREVSRELKAIEGVLEELDDELAEAQFRHQVGEFDDAALARRRERAEPQATEARRRRDELQSRLDTMDRRRSGRDATEETARPADTAPATAPQETGPAAPAPVPPDAPSETFDATSLVDEPVTLEETPAAAEPAAHQAYDPLAALSDPSPAEERSEPTPQPGSPAQPEGSRAPAATRPPAGVASYPSLTIRAGASEGRIVPLLPMTMTIGREHDNNIELKDENVARYHARLVYEEGRFCIEDLESTSGTWVNGVRQHRTALSVGDVIRIGETELALDHV